MNKQILTFLFCLLSFGIINAQTISPETAEVQLSKEAQKAAKKGGLTFMGAYPKSSLDGVYFFYRYQPKKSPVKMDVVEIDDKGNIVATKTEDFTEENLSAYKITLADEIKNEGGGGLAGKKVAYLKGPILAGKPTLNIGTFKNRYTNGLWTGYKFEEESDQKLEEKFWPLFTIALGTDEKVDNQNYLLAKFNGFSQFLQGRRTYLPMDGKALICGLKATSQANVLLIGVFDLATKQWDSKEDLVLDAEISLETKYTIQDREGNIHCLVNSANGPRVLQFSPQGKLLHHIKLSFAETRLGINPTDPDFLMTKIGNALYVAGPSYANNNGKSPSIGICKIEDGKETLFSTASNEQLINNMVLAPKCKVKFKKESYLNVDKIVELPSGKIMVFFASSGNRADMTVNNYLAQFSANGNFETAYTANAIEGDFLGFGLGVGHQEPIVKLHGENLIWFMRTVPDGWQKGVYFESDYTDLGVYGKKTITTMRNDEVYQKGSLVVIQPEKRKMSNQVSPEDVIVGAAPLRVMPSGLMMLDMLNTKKFEYSVLLIKP